jgi:hypothetical protein
MNMSETALFSVAEDTWSTTASIGPSPPASQRVAIGEVRIARGRQLRAMRSNDTWSRPGSRGN